MVERKTLNLVVVGSIPIEGVFCTLGSGKVNTSTLKRYYTNAFVAQMVERKTLNLVVVGSIPIEGVFLYQGRTVCFISETIRDAQPQ